MRDSNDCDKNENGNKSTEKMQKSMQRLLVILYRRKLQKRQSKVSESDVKRRFFPSFICDIVSSLTDAKQGVVGYVV